MQHLNTCTKVLNCTSELRRVKCVSNVINVKSLGLSYRPQTISATMYFSLYVSRFSPLVCNMYYMYLTARQNDKPPQPRLSPPDRDDPFEYRFHKYRANS